MTASFRSRRRVLKAVAAAASAAASPRILAAADYPNRPLQLVVPFNPGGGADRSMRLFAPYLAAELGQPVNVVNIAGGGGWVAWASAARWDAEADDHRLQLVNLPHVFSYMDPRMERSETLESFNFLAWHSYDPAIFVVRNDDRRFPGMEHLIEYVQANADEVIVSTTAVGSDNHMTVAFCERNIPDFRVRKLYATSDDKKIQELLGNISDVIAANTGYYVPYLLDARMRALCVFHDERWPELPNVPTFREITGLRMVAGAGRTLATANGLAEHKRAILLSAIERAMNNPEYIVRELQNRNRLTFSHGEDMIRRLHEFRDMVAEIRYWEAEL